MLFGEYDEKLAREVGFEEGFEDGFKDGFSIALRNLMESTGMELAQAMNALKIPETEQAEYAAKLKV